MRFLCLPGAYGSSDKFQVQLAPFVKELESDNTASFHFIHGPRQAFPPDGFEEFFGNPPYYRFIEPDDLDAEKQQEGGEDVLTKIRNFPEGLTPEDTMRELMKGALSSRKSTVAAIEYLYNIMETEGPFDGIVGYSEGATVAASLMMVEQKRAEESGVPSMFKYAIFFAGWPPLNAELTNMILSDETDSRIEIPTIHIIGSLDPYLAGSMALYNACDPDTAYLFDHAKGHTLPRDKHTVKELGDVIRLMISDIA